jgi:hypothetical protein
LKQGEFATGVVITFQVMAFTGMSPGYPDAVSAFPHGRQKKLWIHPAGAGYPYDPDVGRVFHPADTGKIGGAVAAPVAQKSGNFRFPIRHIINLLFISLLVDWFIKEEGILPDYAERSFNQ